jgi:endonuclease VIII
MPEGPSVVILKEQVQQFLGKELLTISGNTKIDLTRISGRKLTDIRSWGKHFLLSFGDLTIRIHFLMWGSYLINDQKERPVRLGLKFDNGEINFYSCSVRLIEGNVEEFYDFSSDVMSDTWDPGKAKAKLKSLPGELVCDILLDQEIFSGVGNIIKNEVLYRIKVHPESLVGEIPPRKINQLIAEARIYSFQFYEWKKRYELKKHWLAHTKKTCLRCNLPFLRKHTGKRNRRSFFCVNCQKLYA